MSLVTWLNGLTCVAPFTVADAGELYNTIKTELGKQSIVDVHITPVLKGRHVESHEVHVSIDSPTLKYVRTYAVVTR